MVRRRLGIGVAPPLRGLRFRLTDDDIIKQVRTGKNGMPAFPNTERSRSQGARWITCMLRDRPRRRRRQPSPNGPDTVSPVIRDFWTMKAIPRTSRRGAR